MTMIPNSLPFIYGSQYYRAPTPDRQHWAGDLRRMAESGFTMVKFWAQWRWSQRMPDSFFFDDLDELMDLAADNGLAVTINTIVDVAPVWLYRQYPDCRMVTADGRVVQPQAVSCRQLGGYPGPCFNHPEAWKARQAFLAATVARYVKHPAMAMWDVWNEPESNLAWRAPKVETLLCYCDNCQNLFRGWLQIKYHTIKKLNDVWGRCYNDWTEIELPRCRENFSDMVDWRLFHLDTLAQEARRRIEVVKSIDQQHATYLHPVPNTMEAFNSITGVDDFQVADGCDCFGGTTNGLPVGPIQTISAAQGRVCYNVESHLRAGRTGSYPRTLTLDSFARAFLPQLGLGIRGFLHWQYRGETLGSEAPAWGLLEPDGSVGITHEAAAEFWRILSPVAGRLMQASPTLPEVAIFRSCANEIFHWCAHGNTEDLGEAVQGFTRLFYELNVGVGYVNEAMVIRGLPRHLRLLVLPMTWALDQATADAILAWVEQGGTLICEGLTGSFDLTRGRHSEQIPGLGLATAFGLQETGGTAVRHLRIGQAEDASAEKLGGDFAKALKSFGQGGGDFVPLRCESGELLTGRRHYAEIAGEKVTGLAARPGSHRPCVGYKKVGQGTVYYAATQIGWLWGPEQRQASLRELARQALAAAHITPVPGGVDGLRIDRLETPDGVAVVLTNLTDHPVEYTAERGTSLVGLFSGKTVPDGDPFHLTLHAQQSELLVPPGWLGSLGSPA